MILIRFPTLLLVTALGTLSDDWPRWGGPARTGVSTEAGWTLAGEALWSTNVGMGYSSFAVANGRLYTLGYDRQMQLDVVFCLDAETGEEFWSSAYPSEIWDQDHPGGTLTTPAVDGDRVYTSNREGRLFCFDAKSGEILWERHQEEDFGIPYPTWGFAASPLVLSDRLIMNIGLVMAYHKATGELEWKSERNYGHAYSTPAGFEHEGERSLAVFASEGLAILRERDGKELAFQAFSPNLDRVAAMTPVVVDTKIFISAGYERGCAMVALQDGGAEILWESKVLKSHMTGPVLFDDHLYGYDGSMLKCIDMDGNELWRVRGLSKGALVMAQGKLIINTKTGELLVAEATPEGFHELSRAEVFDRGVCWTPPVLANGRIYCRNSLGDVVCRDHRGVK